MVLVGFFLWVSVYATAQEVLPSWNEGKVKSSIINYVNEVTEKKSPDYIPVADRIAVFDNDGTLWSEQPAYFQFFFAIDKVKALAPQHPEWKTTEPFKSVLENNMSGIVKSGKAGLLKLVEASHSGMDAESFRAEVKAWIKTAQHPTKHRSYTDLVFQPMMELIAYFEANDFKVFVVSGGGIDFMRAFIPEVYGIPSERIIGSTGKVHYENGKIVKEPKIAFIDDKEMKPVAIYYHIGKRPVAAFGNSDGDLAMMQYTEANKDAKTLQLYVHHTDAKREWAYDRKSHIGQLDKGLDYAKIHHWTIADMKKDWKVIYPFELKK
jgi:phosphoserine phosphatase